MFCDEILQCDWRDGDVMSHVTKYCNVIGEMVM